MLSFKHLLAAAFVVGSLLNTGLIVANGPKEEAKASFLETATNTAKSWAAPAAVMGGLWLLGKRAPVNAKKYDFASLLDLGTNGLAKVAAGLKYCDDNKYLLSIVVACGITTRQVLKNGVRNTLNNVDDGMKYLNMKFHWINAFINAETKA